jgi:AcrR family transcriptional regulator
MTDLDSAEPGRRERKRLQQLDHLADTAWDLFEAEGYEQVTMERIALVADVAKGTLYKHFPVKEALLRHRFHRELREGEAEGRRILLAEPPGPARLRRFMAASAAWSERNRRYLPAYLQFRLSEPRRAGAAPERSGLEPIFASLIADGQAAGAFRHDIEPAALAVYLEFLYLAALMRWLSGAAESLAAEMERMLAVFLGGLEYRP